MKMAKASERPNLPWEFHVVNDASVNAFALPGGFIYVTRGLMTSINDEAELATVVGHEIGHVTNRHSVQQISKAQLAQLGLGLGSILSSDVARMAGLASQGLSVLFLKYSRDAENQADQAGFRYALNQNYDVREMANVFQTLDRMSQTSGGGKLPEWLATHPNPGTAHREHPGSGSTRCTRSLSNTIVNREEYLQHVANMTYGEDPRQGFFENGTFYHPDLRFQLALPAGVEDAERREPRWWRRARSRTRSSSSPGRARRRRSRRRSSSCRSRASSRATRRRPASTACPRPRATSRRRPSRARSRVSSTFISYNGNTYGILGYTPAGQAQQLRRGVPPDHRQLQPAPEPGGAQRAAGQGGAGEAAAGDDAGAVQPAVPVEHPDRGAGDHQRARIADTRFRRGGR